jgi:hypothetical protein
MIFKAGEIEFLRMAFFTLKEEDLAIFILLGEKHYEITYNLKDFIPI